MNTIRRTALSLLAAALFAAPRPAGAQAPAEEQPEPPEAPPTTGIHLEPEQRRDPAQYRGRPRETDVADGLLWIPRVLFLPAFAVAELGVRRPVYAGGEWIDRHRIVPILDRVFNPTPDISWSPTVTLDLGANSAVGVKGKWRNMLVPGHELKASVQTGGESNWRVAARDFWSIGPYAFAGARGDLSELPTRAFYGLGPGSPNVPTNFSMARYEGFLFQGLQIDNHFRVELQEGYRIDRTGPGRAPSIETIFDTGSIPGFGEVQLAMAMLDFRIDSRRVLEENGGVRLAGNVTYGHDVQNDERSFVVASLDLEGAVEVSHPDRVLAARVYATEAIALGNEPVPFTHLPMLGWQNHVGFIWGRFRGDSAVLAELQYRYPIGYFVDAQWTASAGNVLGERFAGLHPGAMTGSIGVGLRTRRAGFGPLELTIALGTTRFDQPFDFESVRVYFGTTEGL